jgi:F-type H+-transporting ATPase subunit delta
MKNYLIADRYARGLSKSITDDGQLENVLGALQELSELFLDNHALHNVLSNPSINIHKRAAILSDTLTKVGAPDVLSRLADVLLRRGRIAVLSDVAKLFSTLVDERLQRVSGLIKTAVPLEQIQQDRLKSALEKVSGKTVRVTCEIDPEVLGGVVARMGSTIIDGSVRTRLERLRETLVSKEQ